MSDFSKMSNEELIEAYTDCVDACSHALVQYNQTKKDHYKAQLQVSDTQAWYLRVELMRRLERP